MKKLFTFICLSTVLGYLLFPGVNLAQIAKPIAPDCQTYCDDTETYDPPPDTFCLCSPTTATTFEELLDNLTDYIFFFATVLVPILIIVAGFYFMTAAGDPQKLDKAKKIILYTVIGYAIVLFSKGLVAVLKDILGG